MSTELTTGDAAPEFELLDQHGNLVNSKDLRGQKTVLFVYPGAMTPGCTKEACDFRDNTAHLEALGYRVIGLSKDAVEKQLKFSERDSLNYPLLSDPQLELHRKLGAYGPKKLYGKLVEGVIRSTFVIDENWVIEHALRNVKATGHVARIVKLLEAA
ncbi:thioredoxin-dependent thiol peroxidase [Canibacter zhoujuaniae]|uniref:thioredoxin-dependent thiol peroxidase n=1 Tax=Canibacter zhoujuaniae TaxID=2708343 RepID=UPI00142075DD|nr:thioredoxin-dependent thiol peroxidase [Canibacter zhoujuaniae]